MQRILTNISLLAGFALGTTALAQVIISAPAFNAELRQGNAFGETALLLGRDMYDRPAYLYQQAASFVRADLVALGTSGDDVLVASPELAEQRALQAVALARESLSMAPGNTGAWMVLAWAQLLSGEPSAARTSLNISWRLAPYSYVLSEERISISMTLFDSSLYFDDSPSLTDTERTGLIRDFETLWLHRGGLYDLYSDEARQIGLPFYVPQPERASLN